MSKLQTEAITIINERLMECSNGNDSMTQREELIIEGLLKAFSNQKSVLKVKRTAEAKKFPLIKISKDGDVGYDLHSVLPYHEKWECDEARAKYLENVREEDHADVEREIFRQRFIINPHDKITVPTGIFIECPPTHWAAIEARSGTSADRILVPKGIIDEGYRGELFAVLVNIGDQERIIKHGERYVQLIMHKRVSESIDIEEVDELSDSERGTTGFNSTGR